MYFYKKVEPEVGDLLSAKIVVIDNLGVKIKLVEYDNKEGYILYNNLQKRRKNDINQLYKSGKEIFVEYVGYFESTLSFTDKNLDAEVVKSFESKFKKYYRTINLITSFLQINKSIDSKEFFDKVLYLDFKNEDDEYEPFELIKKYDQIIKDDTMPFDLDESIKDKFYDYVKKHTVETKYKGSLKFETYSVNSSGLNDIKNFYKEISKFCKDNNIEIEIKLDTSPNYLISFKEERYSDDLDKKINLVVEYVNNTKPNFNNKLISMVLNES